MGSQSHRTWIPDYIIDKKLASMGQEIKTLLALSRFANKHGVAWPSVKTMSKLSGGSERTTRRHLRLLAKPDAGIMMQMSAGKGGYQCTTRYRLFSQICLHLSRNSGTEYDGSDGESGGESAVDNLLETTDNPDTGDRVIGKYHDKHGLKPGQTASLTRTPVSGEGITEGMTEGGTATVGGKDRNGNSDGNGKVNGVMKEALSMIGKSVPPGGCGHIETRRRADKALQRLAIHKRETAIA